MIHDLRRQLYHSDHSLTRLDPRVKLLTALVLLGLVLSSRGIAFPLLIAISGCGLCLGLGVRPRQLALRFAQPLVIAALVLLLKLFFSGSEPLFTLNLGFGQLVGHYDGLLAGGLIAGRIAGAVTVVAVLGFTTPFTELMAALAWLWVPAGFIEISLFSWRWLFVLFDDALVVYSAQKNRLGYSGWRRGLRSFGTLTGTLVIKAFDSSQTLTTAMVQRGYDGTLPLLRHQPFRYRELVGSVAFLVVATMAWSV